MQRDPVQLTRDRYDVLVIGGGIHGLFAAYDAASRGFRTALIDRGDFGGAISGHHQRTLHGGLRALQSGDLKKMRAQIRERRTWARIAPHLIRPLPFLFGTYRSPKRSRLAVRLGFKLYDFFARKRNDDVMMELHLPKGRLESAAATKRLFRGIDERGLTGGAMWYDYQITQSERLTWAVAVAAANAGAVLANYVEAIGPGTAKDSVRAKDLVSGNDFDITAGVVILAAAEGLGGLYSAFALGSAPPLLRAMNLLLDRPAMDMALVAPTASGRMLTSVPWRGLTLVGTSQTSTAQPAGSRATEQDVAAFLADVNATFPRLAASMSDVRLVHEGLVPAATTAKGLDLLPDFDVTSHRNGTHAKIVSLVGAKYTTARLAAERAVDQAASALGRSGSRCKTAMSTLPHAEIADVEGQLIEAARALNVELSAATLKHLGAWYGTEAKSVLEYAAASPFGLAPLTEDSPVLAAEIPYARECAMAITVEDALLRRTALGGVGRVAQQTAKSAHEAFAERR